MKTKLLLVILVCSFLAGCNQVRQIRSKVKSLIFGSKQEVVQEEELEEPDEETDYSQFQASKEVDKITPRTKTINLMRAYTQAQDKTYTSLLVKAIESHASVFTAKKDVELVSFIYKLGGFIQNGSEEALDITYMWYLKLEGDNKLETAKVLSLAFDYTPGLMFSKFGRELEKNDCQLVYSTPPRIVKRSEKKSYLTGRVDTLNQLLATSTMESSMYNTITNCVQRLDFFIKSL